MKTLAHLTLNTGHLRMSPRAEVTDAAIRLLDPVVRDTTPAGVTVAGVTIRMQRAKRGASFTLGIDGHAMIVGALVWDDATAEHTWTSCVDLYRAQNHAEPPTEMPYHIPWIAIQMPVAALLSGIGTPDEWMQLADLERCIAWTILAQEGLAR